MELDWKKAGDVFYATSEPGWTHVVSKITTCGWVYMATSRSGKVIAPKTSFHSASNAMVNGPKTSGSAFTAEPWTPSLGERVKPSKNFLRRFFNDWHDVQEIVVTRTELVYIDKKLAWIECNCAEHFPDHTEGTTYTGFCVYPDEPEKNDIDPLE